MGERYVISIMARKDIHGNEVNKWIYAGADNGSHGSGYPCWCYSDHDCRSFGSVKDAKEWFNDKTKSWLLGSHYDYADLDLNTLVSEK